VPGFSWYSSLSPPQHPVFQLAVRSGQGLNYLMQGQTFTCNGERHTAGVNMVEVSLPNPNPIPAPNPNPNPNPTLTLTQASVTPPGLTWWRRASLTLT